MNLTEFQHNGYAPYSQKVCRAIVQSTDGSYFPGVRVENAVYPLRIAAVQNALFCCLSEGKKPELVYSDKLSGHRQDEAFWQQEYGIRLKSIEELTDISFAPAPHSVQSVEEALQGLLQAKLAPYSRFPVAALLETSSGFVSGINIEPGDWSRGLCAERVALGKAFSYGITQFKALHVATRLGEYSSPCGACRQVIIEHLPHHPVHLHHADGTVSSHFSSDLLPYSFQSSTLQQ